MNTETKERIKESFKSMWVARLITWTYRYLRTFTIDYSVCPLCQAYRVVKPEKNNLLICGNCARKPGKAKVGIWTFDNYRRQYVFTLTQRYGEIHSKKYEKGVMQFINSMKSQKSSSRDFMYYNIGHKGQNKGMNDLIPHKYTEYQLSAQDRTEPKSHKNLRKK